MPYLSTSLCMISNIVDDLPGKQVVALGEVTTQILVSTIMYIFVQDIKYIIWYVSQNYIQFISKMCRMVISLHIILFLAIALIPPDATSYSIDDKSVDRASVAGTNHLNSNLWQVVLIRECNYGISYQPLTNALHEFTPRETVSREEAMCRFETNMALS